jgi:hypothetical protein
MSGLPPKFARDLDLGVETGANGFTPFTPFTPNPREITREFPTDALPKTLARLVSESAAAIGCPPDGIGLAALVSLGAAIGNSRVVRLKSGWVEGAAIYGALVMESGEKKTAAIAAPLKVCQDLENRLQRQHERDLDEHERDLREYEVEKREAAKAGEPAGPPPREPVAERVYVNDTTIEALIPILKDNPRGVIQERDELVGWVKAMDQYRSGGKGADRQFWLSAWSNRPVSVDRKGQRPMGVLRPFVSVVGSIQPDVLPELAENREDGMLERFLFVFPDALNSMWTDDEITDAALAGYRDLYHRLRSLSMETDELGDPIEKHVGFSPEAKETYISCYNAHRTEMALPGFPRNLRSPWAKLEGYLARLILIVACCRFVEDGSPERIEVEDVLRAVRLVDYFKGQARMVYGALRGFDWRERLVEDVARFLLDCGGEWSGKAEELHAELPSAFKHERPDDLSKFLKKRAETHRELGYKSKIAAAKKDDGTPTTIRRLTLTLLKNSKGFGVNGVNGVNEARGESES